MKISIVTLNYNGLNETIELLKTLKNQTDSDFEIIVVDNASEEVIHIPTRQVGYPQVKFIKNSQNLGFSGGCNIGIRQALSPSTRSLREPDGSSEHRTAEQEISPEWIILLNNDTWVEKDFISALKTVLETKDGIIGIPLVEDDPIKSQGDHKKASRVAYCGKIQWLKPTLWHVYESGIWNPAEETQGPPRDFSGLESGNQAKINLDSKFYAIGGAVAIHRDVFKKIGLLDEKYFLYFEDADFSIRAKRTGFNFSITENISVHHHVSSSTKKLGSSLLLRYHYRNALYFNLKNGPWYIKLAVWPWSFSIATKQLGKLVVSRKKEQSKAILAGVIDFYKHRMGRIKN